MRSEKGQVQSRTALLTSDIPPMTKILEVHADPIQKSALPETVVRQMYDLLGSNMTRIAGGAGTDWANDSTFRKWRDDVFRGDVQKHTSHILLLDDNGLRGFLSYSAPPDTTEIYLNEVQIRPSCQGDGVRLRGLIRSLTDRVRQLPHDQIQTYSNKANTRANALAAKVGFHKVAETDRGCRYRMNKSQFTARFTVQGRRKRPGHCPKEPE